MKPKSNAPARRRVLKSDLIVSRLTTTVNSTKLTSLALSLILLAGCAKQLHDNSNSLRDVLTQISTYGQLKQKPEAFLQGVNLVYAIKIEGMFQHVKTRSMPRQSKPYKVMAELVKTQPTFEF